MFISQHSTPLFGMRFLTRFPEDGFRSRLYVDKEDEKILKDAVIKRGLATG